MSECLRSFTLITVLSISLRLGKALDVQKRRDMCILSKMDPETLLDKIRGTLIGIAVGDALGVPHEFYNMSKNVYTGLLHIPATFQFKRGPSWTNVVGQYSDDTEMTLTNVRSVIKEGRYDVDEVIKAYMRWTKVARAMGNNTRALLKGIVVDGPRARPLKTYKARWNKKFANDIENSTQSNGSLMRCAMLAFLKDSEVEKLDCEITNPSPVNIAVSHFYCGFLRLCVLHSDKRVIKQHLLDLDVPKSISGTVQDALADSEGPKPLVSRDMTAVGKGWVLHGLYCAVWGFFALDTYQDTIDTIILLGGDTDTNAAIAGAIQGAFIGYNGLAKEHRTSKNIEIVRNADFGTGDTPLAPLYLLDDFDKMTEEYEALVEGKWI